MQQESLQLKAELHATKLVLKLLLEKIEHVAGGSRVANNVRDAALAVVAAAAHQDEFDQAVDHAVRSYFRDVTKL